MVMCVTCSNGMVMCAGVCSSNGNGRFNGTLVNNSTGITVIVNVVEMVGAVTVMEVL